MELFTIGFTKKSAEYFFETLNASGCRRIVDVRLNNVSQLAGFAKRRDLQYFLRRIGGMDYVHTPVLAPTKEMLDAYKKSGGSWSSYEDRFLELMANRRIEQSVPRELLDRACLLCSEDDPQYCHRRLVAEYLGERWSDIVIHHLT